jgi:hypothetical protein
VGKRRSLILLFLVFLVVSVGGYLGKNIFQLSLSDQIYVGQIAMENPDLVVGRDNRFQKSNSPTLVAQLLFSVWNRIANTSRASQRFVVTDSKGNILLDRDFITSGNSTVLNLHPIQQKTGKYSLTWYVNNKAIADRNIFIE